MTVKLETASLGTITSGPVTPLSLLSVPSIVKLLLRGRCPPTDGPEPAPKPPVLPTPACSSEAFNTPDPTEADGMSCRTWFSYVVDRLLVVVSIVGGVPETST